MPEHKYNFSFESLHIPGDDYKGVQNVCLAGQRFVSQRSHRRERRSPATAVSSGAYENHRSVITQAGSIREGPHIGEDAFGGSLLSQDVTL